MIQLGASIEELLGDWNEGLQTCNVGMMEVDNYSDDSGWERLVSMGEAVNFTSVPHNLGSLAEIWECL